MEQLAFHEAGCEPTRWPAGLKVRLRRRLRNLLLPMFLRLVEILGCLCHRLEVAEKEAQDLRNLCDDLRRRQEEQAARLPATLAFGWDYVAMVRRLAALEEHVDALLAARDREPIVPVRFPVANGLQAEPAPRSRVG
jgi:hypothetical protein